MKSKLPIILLSLLLAGCQQEKSQMPVYPRSLSKAPNIELGEAIKFLIPDTGVRIYWDWRSNDGKILWLDNGFVEHGEETTRKGLMRINVLGVHSTVLRAVKEELGWYVEMSTRDPAKFGPTKIMLEAGLGSGEQCFGSTNDGCDFETLPSLKKAGLDAQFVCEEQKLQETIKGYRINAPGKIETLLIERTGGGSGGQSTSIYLLLKANSTKLCEFD
jgi:hypothetical protein